MPRTMRKSGIPQVGEIPLGTHFFNFFDDPDNLYHVIVPFLQAGLEEGELCFWLVAEPATEAEATDALRRKIGHELDELLASRKLIVQSAGKSLAYKDKTDTRKLDEMWTELLRDSHRRGFTGVRVAGCVSWVTDEAWPSFADYECHFQESVVAKPMIVVCSFPAWRATPEKVIDLTRTHQFALAKTDGRAELVDTQIARLHELDMRNERQAAIAALGQTAIRERDLGLVMDDAAALAARILGTGRSIVWEVREDGREMILRASAGWPELGPETRLAIEDGNAARFALMSDLPVIVSDLPNDPRFKTSWVLHEHGIQSLLTAIVRGHERPWGIFSVHSKTAMSFDAEDVEFLQALANVLALAVERKEAEDERARIQSITDTALAHMNLDDLLAELLARLGKALRTDYAMVALLHDADPETLYVRAIDGMPLEEVASLTVPVATSPIGPIVREKRPLMFDPPVDGSSYWSASLGMDVRAGMGVPLLVEGKIIGVVFVTTIDDRKFSERDLQLLNVVADRAAPAIERARLTESVRAGRERMESLSRRLLTMQEEERRRVAFELHDELGQLLTVIKMNIAASPGNAGEALDSVDTAMQTVRDLALDLRPPMLDDLGLAAALRWYADRFSHQTGIPVHVALEDVPGLDPGVAIAAFRVAQEALTNIARHALAKNAWVTLRSSNDSIDLMVRDDGAGFDVKAANERAARGSSLGLIGMQERVALAGGTISIESAPGGGANVRAQFPVT